MSPIIHEYSIFIHLFHSFKISPSNVVFSMFVYTYFVEYISVSTSALSLGGTRSNDISVAMSTLSTQILVSKYRSSL